MAARKKAEPQTPQVIYTVTAPGGLNVRSEASRKAKIVRVLACGESIAERSADAPSGWMAVDGGYIMRKYVSGGSEE